MTTCDMTTLQLPATKAVHSHPLAVTRDLRRVAIAVCDVCHSRGSCVRTCLPCDFDVCEACLKGSVRKQYVGGGACMGTLD